MEKKVLILFGLFILGCLFSSLFFANAFLTDSIFYTGVVQFFLNPSGTISIDSPQNTSYSFAIGENRSLPLNLSYGVDIISWNYSLRELKHGSLISENVSLQPNITFEAARWSNQLSVFGWDSINNLHSASVIFYVHVNNSAPFINYLPPNLYVCENQKLSYFFNGTDIDEDNISEDISPKHPFYLEVNSRINYTSWKYEIYSDYIGAPDIGIHEEVISLSDLEYADSRNVNITSIEINNAPVISDIGAKTVWITGENNSLHYQINVSDPESGNQDSGNFSFNVSFSGKALFNISGLGVINYSVNSSDIGNYTVNVSARDTGLDSIPSNISLCGQDGGPITSYKVFSLVITDENRAPRFTGYYPVNLSFSVSGDINSYFNATVVDPEGGTLDVYWYVDGVLKSNDFGILFSEFNYTFGCGVSGIHYIRAVADDGNLTSSLSWNVSVDMTGCPGGVTGGGGGGGGGGCTERWACNDWQECINMVSGELDSATKNFMRARCSLYDWGLDKCGYQIRSCFDINKCGTNLSRPDLMRECLYSFEPGCSDGIKNCHDGKCEVLADCGGPCKSCPSCFDRIKNQGEIDIDCGGPCQACIREAPLKFFESRVKLLFIILGLLLILANVIFFFIWFRRKRRESQAKKELRRKWEGPSG